MMDDEYVWIVVSMVMSLWKWEFHQHTTDWIEWVESTSGAYYPAFYWLLTLSP